MRKVFGLYQKECKTLWRQSRLWLIMAALAFLISWLFLHMLDRYLALQPELLKLSAPPNLTDALLLPLSHNLVKVLLLLVSVTAGTAVAEERQSGTVTMLLRAQRRHWYQSVVMCKFRSHLWLLLFPVLILLVVAVMLSLGGVINWWQVGVMLLGWLLFGSWLIAVALWLSSLTRQTGFAVLLCLVVLSGLWVVGGQAVFDEYGINWLNLMLPEHHLNGLFNSHLNISSVLYFIGGAALFLYWSQANIHRLRHQL